MGFRLFESVSDLFTTFEGSIKADGMDVTVEDEDKLREKDIDWLIYNAVFNQDDNIQIEARSAIRSAARSLGIKLSSMQGLYEAMGRGDCGGFSVPAINIRGLTYDTARAIFRAAKKNRAGAFIFEIAKSEIDYTLQRPSEYTVVILAAAIKEGFIGPVFIQGDHFQVNPKNYKENAITEIKFLKDLISEAVENGFYNIDIDASTVVDLRRPTVTEQQKNNYEITSELTKHIRKLEGGHITISVGGEIGEVGSKNSTEEELRAFMDGYNAHIDKGMKGISKISIQTGTSHGGVPLPDGKVAKVKVDFDTIEQLSKVAVEDYGLCGVVQHGASTLPDDCFHLFAERGAAEVHLATGFQNILYDSKHFPKDLQSSMYTFLGMKFPSEKTPDMTNKQFIYKTRKKALGPYKERLWNLPEKTKNAISNELEKRFDMLFKSLKVVNSEEVINKWIY